MGVTWMLRPTRERVRTVQHGGDLGGQHSGFLKVPDRGFALVMLTNSEGGPGLLAELFADDWALRRYAGVLVACAATAGHTPEERNAGPDVGQDPVEQAGHAAGAIPAPVAFLRRL